MKTFQDLFQRYRRPGDLVISIAALLFALFLLISLPTQTTWIKGQSLFAQPAFWPAVAVISMVLFSGLHFLGAIVSPRIPGRSQEILYWFKALEYPVWFLAYVALVPWLGYLPSTIIFTVALSFRLGYRGWKWTGIATIFSIIVVILFKGFLRVKIPAGEIYSLLPPGDFRLFVMIWL
ncbi:MAG: tripartite tricarboxylate transporter TctB family protein [Sulfitobacter sp.]|nr:tripartite tricarboxylate transporter TctB family protein [Sulfitobacter sp.]